MVDQTPLIRREVTYVGRVQGVGFRYTTRQVAGRYPITGTVENCSDGTVFVAVEGTAGAVKQFLDDLAETMRRYIEQVIIRESVPTGEFSHFSIRR